MTIERFHSRSQLPFKFVGTKQSVCITKELKSYRIGLVNQYGRRFIVSNMAAVTSRESALYRDVPWWNILLVLCHKVTQ